MKATCIRTWQLSAAALCLLAARGGQAALLGPYSADANTVYLYHLNEAAGSSSAANSGSAGTAAISYDGNPYAGDGVDQPTVTTVLGAAGYPGFGSAADLSAANDLGLGVDISGNGAFGMDDNAPLGVDRLPNHSSIFGAGNVFTLEAMVKLPAITGANREIIATDSSGANTDRGFQFRIGTAGVLEFNFIGVATSSVTTPIPTTGDHAFVANEWFHVAMAYDGANAQFYWTRVAPMFTAANPVGGLLAEGVDVNDPMVLVIGNEGRVVGTTGSTEGLLGFIDEVRISNVLRGPGDFIFAVPEPSTSALGLGGLALLGRRRRSA